MRNFHTLILFFLLSMVSCSAQETESGYDGSEPIRIRKVSILGDSYSTMYGYMTPDTNLCWYASDTDKWHPGQDVVSVEHTWWHKVISASNGQLVLERNNSYSGSTLVNTPLEGMEASTSFINRADNLGSPNIILVFGGTNDNWNSALSKGDFKYSDWTEEDKKDFRPGTAYLLNFLQTEYPGAEILFILNDILDNVTADIITICKHYDITVVQPQDIDKIEGHPTHAGMTAIAAAVASALGFTLPVSSDSETDRTVTVAEYFGNRQAAVSLTFDDGQQEHYSVVAPQLDKNGLHGTFGLNGKFMGDRNDSYAPRMTWEECREMLKNGHEMTSHGWSHINLYYADEETLKSEIEKNDSIIVAETGVYPKTFIYPFNGYNDQVIATCEINRVTSRKSQFALGQVNSGCTAESVAVWLEDIVNRREWGVTLTHGIYEGWDQWNEPQILWDFFEELGNRREEIWTDTFARVGAYVRERDEVKLDVQIYDDELNITPALNLDPDIFDMPLTLIIRTDKQISQATQDSEILDVTYDESGSYLIDINPYGGAITVKL